MIKTLGIYTDDSGNIVSLEQGGRFRIVEVVDGNWMEKEGSIPFVLEMDKDVGSICGHLPPWFEKKLADYGLTMSAEEKGPNNIEVVIEHSTCQG